MISSDQLRRVRLAKLLFRQAKDHVKTGHEANLAACIVSLQDAVEIILLVAADVVNASIPQRVEFDKYLSEINKKISPKTLPLSGYLNRLNRMRVQVKHGGLFPQRESVVSIVPFIEEFLCEVCREYLGCEFLIVSLSDLISDQKKRELIRQAESEASERQYLQAIISARKAFFLEFEKKSDVSVFVKDKNGLLGNYFTMAFCEAPEYAKNIEYIERHVQDVFDYIVLDVSKTNKNLLVWGLDIPTFWNVWRMSPKVYQWSSGDWAVSYDLKTSLRDDLGQDAMYIVDSVAEMLIRKSDIDGRHRYLAGDGVWELPMKAGSRIFSKANYQSMVLQIVEEDTRLPVVAGTAGLDGDSDWWKVRYVSGSTSYGFVREEDVER